MRVQSCKLKCLSPCFSKSSPSLQTASPLVLEDAHNHNNVSSQSSVSHVLEEQSTEEKIDEAERVQPSDVKAEICPKTCLKKSAAAAVGSEEGLAKGRVKWMDFVGEELVEIREFEPIDSGGSDDEDDRKHACTCVIQ